MNNKYIKIILILSLAVFAGLFFYNIYIDRKPIKKFYGRSDFAVFYKAADYALKHKDIYKSEELSKEIIKMRGSKGGVRYLYPPMAVFIFFPLLLFKFQTASNIWLISNITLLGASLFLLQKNIKEKITLLGWCVIILAIAYYQPFFTNFNKGQVNVLLVFLFLLMLFFHQKKLNFLAGLTLALMALIKVFPIVFLGYFFAKKKWRVIAYSLAAIIAIVLICWPFFKTPTYKQYYHQLTTQATKGIYFKGIARHDNATLNGYLYRVKFLTQEKLSEKNVAKIKGYLDSGKTAIKGNATTIPMIHYSVIIPLGLLLLYLTYKTGYKAPFVSFCGWLSYTLFAVKDVHLQYFTLLFPVMIYLFLFPPAQFKRGNLLRFLMLLAYFLIAFGGKRSLSAADHFYQFLYVPMGLMGNSIILTVIIVYLSLLAKQRI